MADEQELVLLFKEQGLDSVKDAADKVGVLGDKLESIDGAEVATPPTPSSAAHGSGLDSLVPQVEAFIAKIGEAAEAIRRVTESLQTYHAKAHREVAPEDRGIARPRHHAQSAEQVKKQAEYDARMNTPEAREHQALAAERNEEMGMAQQVQAARAGMGDVVASQMGPAELQQIVAQVGRNRTMNSSLGFTLAQQVDYFMSQLEAKMVADFTRGMGQHDRSAQNVNPIGGH